MMWNPYKWLDDMIEKAGWWIFPYYIVLRIVVAKFFDIMPESFLLFFGNAWFLVLNFFTIRMILKMFKDNLKNYTVYLYAFSIFYLIIAPLFIIYSSIYHPLLGGIISGILFLISAYSLIFIQKKKGQD